VGPFPTAVKRSARPRTPAQGNGGGGGNYLSNESMYRSNRLRLAPGATDVPAATCRSGPDGPGPSASGCRVAPGSDTGADGALYVRMGE
jgi:hypothetical protein